MIYIIHLRERLNLKHDNIVRTFYWRLRRRWRKTQNFILLICIFVAFEFLLIDWFFSFLSPCTLHCAAIDYFAFFCSHHFCIYSNLFLFFFSYFFLFGLFNSIFLKNFASFFLWLNAFNFSCSLFHFFHLFFFLMQFFLFSCCSCFLWIYNL